MKKRWIAVIACLSLFLTLCGTGIYARTTTSVTNHIDTGIVDITLKEYQLDEKGRLEGWVDNPMVMPGSQISKIPEVTNKGNDCWVRVKLTFENVEGLDYSCLYGLDEDLVYHEDGYFYLHRMLKLDESFHVFQGLNIPADFSQANEDRQFKLHIQVDAIQARNMAADFDSDSPWGTVVIEKQLDEGLHSIRAVKDDNSFLLEYQADANHLIVNAEDFFANISTLVPGDEYRDTVQLKNQGTSPMKLYFCSQAVTRSTLLDDIQLSIRTEHAGVEKDIYDGTIRAEDLFDEILLITIPAGGVAWVHFAVTVPAELDNDDVQLASAVRWIFSTEEINEFTAPYTGDGAEIGLMLMMAGLSLGLVCVLLVWRRRAKDEDDQKAG